MLQQDFPDDFVLSMNEMHSVREFVEKSFAVKGITIKWVGEYLDEVGCCSNSGRILIKVSEKYFRPAEVDILIGDSAKARTLLEWKPKITFDELVKEMVDADCK